MAGLSARHQLRPRTRPSDRDITHRLYGGDESTRVRQEMILGIGGVRALRALGTEAGRVAPERGARGVPHPRAAARAPGRRAALRRRARGGRRRAACSRPTRRWPPGTTPSAPDLIVQHFGDFIRELGICRSTASSSSRARPPSPGLFNMTRLALNGTRHVNGVSRMHGAVSARLCRGPVARGAPGGQPGRLDHQRRARPDLPAPALDGLLRPRARRRVARAPARLRLLECARAGPRGALLGHLPGRQGAHAGERARAAAARVRTQGT